MIEFKEIFWLMLLPLVLAAVALLFFANAKGRKALVRRFASEKLVRELLASYSPARHKLKRALVLLGLAALLVALARPIVGYDWRETKSKGIDILFVLDSSRSMLARDIKPNRLDRAKFAILDFIDRLQGDRVGLVAFAGEAFLQCPLTLDYTAFEQSLQAVDTSVISTGGTDIARAITEAESAFKDDNNHKILVLITDGEDLQEDGVAQARRAADKGVTIYTVGVGTPEGEVIPTMNRFGQVEYLKDSDGNIVTTKLDEETLTQIAEETGGFYVPLGATGYGLEQVYEAGLENIPEQELSAQMERIGIERFQWPIGLAILLLAWEPLIGTRRRFLLKRSGTSSFAVAALLGSAALLLSHAKLEAQEPPAFETEQPAPVPEAEVPEKAAAPEAKDAREIYNQGNRLYAEGDFAGAAQSWQRSLATPDLSLQADAFYNLGNARYRQGVASLADKPTPEALDQADTQAYGAADEALRKGNAILEAATANQIPTALRNQQAQQEAVPQQQIQQAIQMAEQAKTTSEEAKAADESAKGDFGVAEQLWQQAINDYQSASELTPEADDAQHNARIVTRKLNALTDSLENRDEAIERHQRNVENLDRLIEELKKLLEDQQDNQNQDQKQNQQNQDQQEQQQDNQQQNQEQQGQQNQDQQNQSGDQDQQQGDQSQQQEQQQGEQGEQSQEQQSQQEQGDQQGSEQQGEQGSEQSEGSEEQPGQDQGSQPGEQSQEESPGQQGEEEREGGGGQEPMKLSEEDAQKAGEMAAGEERQAGEGSEEQGAAAGQGTEQVQLGVMSREQARRFLESMKDEEKKLPVSGYGPLKYRVDEEGKRKDW